MSSSSPASTAESTSSRPAFLKRDDVIGKPVIGLDGHAIGNVKDLAITADGKTVIQVEKGEYAGESTDKSEGELYVNSDEILAIGEVVLLRHSSKLAGKSASVPASPGVSTAPTPTPAPMPAPSASVPPPYPTTTAAPRSTAPPPAASAQGKVCARCNYVNSSTSKFCIKCGNALPA